MDELNLWTRLRRYAVFALLCCVIMFFHLIPLSQEPLRYPPPELMLCLTTAIVIRRAVIAPYWLVAILFFISDILFDRPLGLWTFIVLVFVELVRNNRFAFREMFFATEWAIISVGFGVALFTQKLFLTFALAPTLPGTALMWQLGATVLCYPLAVLFLSQIWKIRKPVPGEATALGQKL